MSSQPSNMTYRQWAQTATPEEKEREQRRRLRMITIERTSEEAEESARQLKKISGGKRRKSYGVKDPVEFFRLTVKVEMKFHGKDARAARRWFYDLLRPCQAIFAGFDGPRDPIVMSFYCAAGNQVVDLLSLLLPKQNYEDLEIRVRYQCTKEPEHKGDVKFGQRKKGLARLLDFTKETKTGQMKLS